MFYILVYSILVAYYHSITNEDFEDTTELMFYVKSDNLCVQQYSCYSDLSKFFGVNCKREAKSCCTLLDSSIKSRVEQENDCLKKFVLDNGLTKANVTFVIANKNLDYRMQTGLYDVSLIKEMIDRKLTINNNNFSIHYSQLTTSELTFDKYVGANERLHWYKQEDGPLFSKTINEDNGYIMLDEEVFSLGYMTANNSQNEDIGTYETASKEAEFFSIYIPEIGVYHIVPMVIFEHILFGKYDDNNGQISIEFPCFLINITINLYNQQYISWLSQRGLDEEKFSNAININGKYDFLRCVETIKNTLLVSNKDHPWNNKTLRLIETNFPRKSGTRYFDMYSFYAKLAYKSNHLILHDLLTLMNQSNLSPKNGMDISLLTSSEAEDYFYDVIYRMYCFTLLSFFSNVTTNDNYLYRFMRGEILWQSQFMKHHTSLRYWNEMNDDNSQVYVDIGRETPQIDEDSNKPVTNIDSSDSYTNGDVSQNSNEASESSRENEEAIESPQKDDNSNESSRKNEEATESPQNDEGSLRELQNDEIGVKPSNENNSIERTTPINSENESKSSSLAKIVAPIVIIIILISIGICIYMVKVKSRFKITEL